MDFFPRNKSPRDKYLIKVLTLLNKTQIPNEESLRHFFSYLNEEKFWQLAFQLRVTTILAHCLANLFGWDNIPSRWREFHHQMAEQVKLYNEELLLIAQKLSNWGIEVVALKNNSFPLAFPICPGCCPMSDIDIFISEANRNEADLLLQELGYRNLLDNQNLKTSSSNYHKITSAGNFIILDVHWKPIGKTWLKGNFSDLSQQLMASSQIIPETSVRILTPENNLFQVILHNAKHAYKLKPVIIRNLDVHLIIENQKINWPLFLNLICEQEIKTITYCSLLAAKHFFGTSIPEGVFDILKPPFWKKPLLNILSPAWGVTTNKTWRFVFRIARPILYDNLTVAFRNGLKSMGRARKKISKSLSSVIGKKNFYKFLKRNPGVEKFNLFLPHPEPNRKFFFGDGYNLLFINNGKDIYLHLIEKKNRRVIDSIKLTGPDEENNPPEIPVEILWHKKLKKLGIGYLGKIEAVFDLKKKKSYCRSGVRLKFPLTNLYWSTYYPPIWKEEAIIGLK